MRRVFSLVIAVLLFVLATLPAFAQGNTILDVVSGREDLSTLAAVVGAVDPSIAETLTRTDIPGLTLLAPNNDAFTRLADFFEVDLAFFLDEPELTAKLLRYHVLTGFFSLADITRLDGNVVLTALPGTSIRVNVQEGGRVVLNNRASVVDADVRASNGRIQVISNVLFTGTLEEEIRAAIVEWKAFQELVGSIPADNVVGLVRDSENLSTLLQVILASDQLRLLRDGFPFTVFAPTNEAFDALFAALGVTAEEALANTDLLKAVLRYHILEDVYNAESLVGLAGATLPTLDGEGLVVGTTAEGGVVLNNSVNVVAADVSGFNVVVHVVDAVLVPPSFTLGQQKAAALANVKPRTLLDRLANDARFSTLVDLLVASGITELPAGSTVFAPTNNAFNAAFRALGVSKEQVLLNPELVSALLPYHVVTGVFRADDVVALSGQTAPTLDGDAILVEVTEDGAVVLNRAVNVIETNITAQDGVIHAIDGVLTAPLIATRVAAREALATSAKADSIAFLAATNPDFSILADVIVATGQGRLLSEGFPFTVFAPTNAAFEALLASLGVNLDVALLDNVDLLKTVLRYHVLEDAVMAADITDGAFVETLQGELLGLTVADGVVKLNGQATVVVADVEAVNGVVHVIDTVLTLPSAKLEQDRTAALANLKEDSIVAIAAADPQFSILVDVIVITNSVRLLNEGFPFTVFAPTNDAFRATFRALGVSQQEAYTNVDLLKTVLRYHVLEDAVMAGDITDGLTYTTLQGSDVTFSVAGGTVMVNGATVVAADIPAANGVIHVIDAVLVP